MTKLPDSLARTRARVNAWLNETMTRRRFLPEYVVVVAAVACAFWLLDRQGSEFDQARVEAQVQAETQNCLNRIERIDGLRFNLNEIYDNLDLLYDLIDQNTDGSFDHPLSVARLRIDAGRETIDELYPPVLSEDCVFTFDE